MCKTTYQWYPTIALWNQLPKEGHFYFGFALVCDFRFSIMTKVKATKTSKLQFVLQDFPDEFLKSPYNKLL